MQTVVECRPDEPLARWGAALRRRAAPLGGLVRLGAAALLAACALAPLARDASPAEGALRAVEWPRQFDGRTLRPLALSPVEQRFANAFPGAIGRFSDGERLLVLRDVQRPTRMLHPAADCYRGLGYSIAAARLERDAQQRLWRCFEAERGAQRLRVCERIADAEGQAYTDTSAWFWAAALGRSTGPWQAVTTVAVVDGGEMR
ncbi:hypothetical protein [Methylibium sp. Root1272]|uniref:hypothetical protein n=1 Tax=Methylibium sp. Root1272 TaxID=1736441 RepID=UPI0006F227F2|nr:hypothetical protein [Methylibium sp. Root1272]KQW68804.1 hypothetical protein ASC67_09110 [Methylibium sp. Root1272]